MTKLVSASAMLAAAVLLASCKPLTTQQRIDRLMERGDCAGLAQFLNDPDNEVRRSAAGALGICKCTQSFPQLRTMLLQGDLADRISVVVALEMSEETSLVGPIFLEAYKTEKNRTVKHMLLLGMGKLKYREAIPLLISMIGFTRDGGRAIGILGMIGDPTAVKPISDFLKKAYAKYGLDRRSHGEDFEMTPAEEAMASGVKSLYKLGDQGTRPIMELYAKHKHKGVRTYAEIALREWAP